MTCLQIMPWNKYNMDLILKYGSITNTTHFTTFVCIILLQLFIIQACELWTPAGLQDGSVKDNQFSASSSYDNRLLPWHARLHFNSFWATTSSTNNTRHWIQIDLLSDNHLIRGIQTQGSLPELLLNQWVTSMEVETGTSDMPLKAIMESGMIKTFVVATSVDVADIVFPEPVTARFLRIVPKTWNNWIAMRLEVMVCANATTARDRTLKELVEVNVTNDNVLAVAEDLSVFVMNDLQINDENLQDINNVLSDIVAVGDSSRNVTDYVVAIVDNLINAYGKESSLDNKIFSVPEPLNQIQRALEMQISSLQSQPGNTSIEGRHLAIRAVKVSKEYIVNSTLAFQFIPDDINNTLSVTSGEQLQNETEAAISFQLPYDVLDGVKGNQSVPVSFILYENSLLFPSNIISNKSEETNYQRIVASRVISATVEGIDVRNLHRGNPVETVFALIEVNEKEQIKNIQCVFWNITASNGVGDWSDYGCRHDRTLPDGRIVCHCDHLTNFAVLVDIYENNSVALDVISKIGCGISIFCLIITIITHLSEKKLHTKQPQLILINFCFSLLFLYVVFVIGIERTHPKTGCIVVSVLLHYFTLTTIAWMAVEAFNMYLLFVKIIMTDISWYILKAFVFSWGFPALIVMTALLLDFSQYSNDHHCFIQIGYTFYFTHLLLLGVAVFVNTIIFVLVMHRLTCGRMARHTRDERQEMLKRVKNAIAITLLVGLTWCFGLFALIHEDSSIVFQYCFAIFNSFQGACIFVMFCVMNPDIVAVWKEWLSCIKHNTE